MRSQLITWIEYGGPAWMPEIAATREIPRRIWPVVDVQADNLGTGLIVDVGGLDALIDSRELIEEVV